MRTPHLPIITNTKLAADGRSNRVHSITVGVLLLLTLLACAYVYQPGLKGPLLFDDHSTLSPLLDQKHLNAGDWEGLLLSDTGPLKRPVSMSTFVLNALTSGDDISRWKHSNLMIHLLTGILIFWLSAQIFGPTRDAPDTRSWSLASLITVVWLLHPLHVSTVLYTVQRMAQLSSLFVLAGLLAYVLGRKQQLRGHSGTLCIGLTFLVFLPLAAFSKENGALLPLLAFIVEACVFRFSGDTRVKRIVGFYFFVFLLIPLALASFLLVWNFDALIANGYAGREFSLEERTLTQFRALCFYLYQLVVPIQQNMGFFHDDFVVSKSWMSPPTTLASFVGIALLLTMGWSVRRKVPLVTLGIAFFFAAHVLESTIYPLELVFEHRNYLPSYGVFLALVAVLQRSPFSRGGHVALSAFVVALLATTTSLRAQTWASEASLYSYAYRVHPTSRRVNAQVAESLTVSGRYNEALSVLESIEGSGPALQRLYIQCRRDYVLNEEDLKRVSGSLSSPIDNYTATGLIEVGRLGLDGHCNFSHRHYADLLQKVSNLTVRDSGSRHKLRIYRAHYLWRLHQPEMAIAELEDAHQQTPTDPMPLFLAAEWLITLDELERAKAYYGRAIEVAESSRFSYDDFIASVGSALHAAYSNTTSP